MPVGGVNCWVARFGQTLNHLTPASFFPVVLTQILFCLVFYPGCESEWAGLWKGHRLVAGYHSWGVLGTAGIWVEMSHEGVEEGWDILSEGGP